MKEYVTHAFKQDKQGFKLSLNWVPVKLCCEWAGIPDEFTESLHWNKMSQQLSF